MVKSKKYIDVIQMILDQCKEWSNGDRVGRFYFIGKFPFINEQKFTPIECEVLYQMAISSELFEPSGLDFGKDYRLASIKLTKEGFICVSNNDWNYREYLYQKKESVDALPRRANNTNALIGVLILLQVGVGFRQCQISEQTLTDKSDIELLSEQLQQLRENRKKDYCHSCENR